MLAKVIAPAANLYSSPLERTLETQILFGETFRTEGAEANGWVKGRCTTDNYEGFVRQENLRRSNGAATHLVCAARTCVYPASEVKALPVSALPMGAQVAVEATEGIFARTKEGFIPQKHLRGLSDLSNSGVVDFMDVAQALLGVPYVWGGRDSTKGIDCSALCQLALGVVGIPCPRNSGEQEEALGVLVEKGAPLRRGDFIFWQAHVGILLGDRADAGEGAGAETLLHANAFHMAVAVEPLAPALVRLEKVAGPVRAVKRLSS